MRSGGKLFCVACFVSGTGVAGVLGNVAESGLRVAGKVDVPRWTANNPLWAANQPGFRADCDSREPDFFASVQDWFLEFAGMLFSVKCRRLNSP